MTQAVSVITEKINRLPAADAGSLVWAGDRHALDYGDDALREAIGILHQPVYLLPGDGQNIAVARHGALKNSNDHDGLPLFGWCPPTSLQYLGDPGFLNDYGVRLPYLCGSMANGIASTALVKTAADAGLLASFGAAGLSPDEIEDAICDLKDALSGGSWCSNLIFSPNEPGHEDAVVSLYLKHGVRLVETSAYLRLTSAVVRYRVTGIHTDSDGTVVAPNQIIAKASRIEVARQWLSPPPTELLTALVAAGAISDTEAKLAERIPMANDVTVEADSGGHTDRQPAITVLPTIIALRDRLVRQFRYAAPVRIGAAGGIATPLSAAAAFTMGAAYVVTGTVNQACVESGTSERARQMLAATEQADVGMAPAVDMFEMGVQLQVLKRGTMFVMRANKLYQVYRNYDSVDAIPSSLRHELEEAIFRAPLATIWAETQAFFQRRDPEQIARAERDPKHKLALICRWYLGLASHWATRGEASRQLDYQIWCGPAMGAFNEWTKGTWLAHPRNRTVVTVAMNILYGAAVLGRVVDLRRQGARINAEIAHLEPLTGDEIAEKIGEAVK